MSEYCIKKALKLIDEEDYLKTLNKLAMEKYASLKSNQYLARKKKTIDYLMLKGFESTIINSAVQALTAKKI